MKMSFLFQPKQKLSFPPPIALHKAKERKRLLPKSNNALERPVHLHSDKGTVIFTTQTSGV